MLNDELNQEMMLSVMAKTRTESRQSGRLKIILGLGLLMSALSACAEGRWVHPTKTDVQAQEDWETCKAEVLSGQEHAKDTMAGSINLSGCMQSKGYSYVKDQPPQYPSADNPVSR
ncbi:MAG TPA: hypothetical protein VJ692_08965 [Nitrospiraceae bacterium]|nr:hypothetical protein [Nitrospiraceae bacterium]